MRKKRAIDPMETTREVYIQDLAYRGVIQGVTIKGQLTNTSLCHYFGGLRYALAPAQRWGKARPLPPDHSYGSKENPGQHDGQAAVCPQLGFSDTGNTSEDCFQCNVWVPVEKSPPEGTFLFPFPRSSLLLSMGVRVIAEL
jgi:Carboxylesterase family